MSQKNETTVLILALLGTIGLVGGGLWWFSERLQKKSPTLGTCVQVQNVPTGRFLYGGSTTWAPIRAKVDSEIQKLCPQFVLRYTDHPTRTPGSGTGIQMLIDNQLDFSQSSRSIKSEEQQAAQQKGFSLKEITVGIDSIAIAVHPSLDIPGLTIAQLKDIYTGKITNWNRVGGPDLQIIPYSRRQEDGGTVEFFIENILDKENFAPNVKFVYATTPALRKVATNPGSIYYASAPEIVDQCSIKPLPLINKSNQPIPPYKEPLVSPQNCPAQRNQLNASVIQSGDYPITRKLFVIVKQTTQIDQQAGEAYANLLLTSDGQELMEKAGFVRIR
jgi:phosphate transport system substrate-binding protein